MANPTLEITDGTTSINLLELKGWTLRDWQPSVPTPKEGGIFSSSPFVDGRRLSYRKMDNIFDTFNLIGSGHSQDDLIRSIQELQRLLEKAVQYWISDWQNELVWIVAKGSCEANTRYATIVDYSFTGFGSPYKQPFFNRQDSVASEAILIIEHMIWQDTVPGEEGICVALHSKTDFPPTSLTSGSFYPLASDDDGTWSLGLDSVDLTGNYLGVGYNATFPGDCVAGIIFEDVPIDQGAEIKYAELRLIEDGAYTGNEYTVTVRGQSQRGGSINSATLINGGTNYHKPFAKIYGFQPPGLPPPEDIDYPENWVAKFSFDMDVVPGPITDVHIINGGAYYVNPTIIVSDYELDPSGQPFGSGAIIQLTATPLGTDATAFDGTNDDFAGRSQTDAYTSVAQKPSEAFPDAIDVTDIVREITSTTYWTTGDDIGIFIKVNTDGHMLHAFDVGHDTPEIYIEYYDNDITLGRDKTCAPEVVVSNKSSAAPLNYIFVYDASLGTYSSNIYGYDYTSTPVALLPYNPVGGIYPAVDDCIYFGCSDPISNVGYPFNNIIFDLYSIQSGITIGLWQYYDGDTASWEDFSYSGDYPLCGDELLFKKEGIGYIVFSQQHSWGVTTINGVDAYWVRFKVTGITGNPTPPYQWHRDIYTALNPYVDIDAEEVPGDISAISRIVIKSLACWSTSPSVLLLGLRSLSRGSNFNAYLNASNVQIPGIVFGAIEGSVQEHVGSPTGRALEVTNFNETDSTLVCTWNITSSLVKEYSGTYHAYLRCSPVYLNTVDIIKFQLRSQRFGTYTYSETNTLGGTGYYTYVDLGQFTILPSPSANIPSDVYTGTTIELYACNISSYAVPYNFWIFDIVLIPSDEWIGSFGGVSGASYAGWNIDIDAIRDPKRLRALLVSGNGLTSNEISSTSSGVPMFQSNTDQRLWFFQYDYYPTMKSRFEYCGLVNAQRSARYILMRGSR